MPLTLLRFALGVNGGRGPAVPVPFVEQEKKCAQGEQIIGSEFLPSCGPLDSLDLRQVGAVGGRAHGGLEF